VPVSPGASTWLRRVATIAATLGLVLGCLGVLRGAAPLTEGRTFNGLPPGTSDTVELGTLPPRHLDIALAVEGGGPGGFQLFPDSNETDALYSAPFVSSFRASLDLPQRGVYLLVLSNPSGNESLTVTVILTLSGPERDLIIGSGPFLLIALTAALLERHSRESRARVNST